MFIEALLSRTCNELTIGKGDNEESDEIVTIEWDVLLGILS